MADKAQNYSDTIAPSAYVAGRRVHPWLATMDEVIIREVIKKIQELLDAGIGSNQKRIKIGDIGCGPGSFTLTLAQRVGAYLSSINKTGVVDIVGYDIDDTALKYARAQQRAASCDDELLKYYPTDVHDMRTGNYPFHIVTTVGFFHHFSPDKKGEILSKIYESLASGAMMVDGDEYLALPDWYEQNFGNSAHKLRLAALYFQVIQSAFAVNDEELVKAEVENFLAEAYRNDPKGFPNLGIEEAVRHARCGAREFMAGLTSEGLRAACELALETFQTLDATRRMQPSQLFDRGDYKEAAMSFVDRAEACGFGAPYIYDMGQRERLGSASVILLHKL